MAKISSTGRQFTITIPKDIMGLMGWNKGTEVIISKYPEKDILYIEEVRTKEMKK